MRKIVYHVGMTLDNYIAHEDGSIGGFSNFAEGEHVTEYLESLKAYDTVLMGRATYEFGYQYGLKPGQPAYPHMQHYIFSKTLRFDATPGARVKIVAKDLSKRSSVIDLQVELWLETLSRRRATTSFPTPHERTGA